MNRKTVGIINGSVAAASYGTNPLFALPLYSAGIGVNSVLFLDMLLLLLFTMYG